MRSESSKQRPWILILSLLCATNAVVAGGDRNWIAEIGTEASHRDNFFFRGDQTGTPPPSANFATIFGSGEVEIDAGKNRWTLGAALSGNFTKDIENADYGTADFGAEFKRRKTRGSFELTYAPNRIFSEESDGTFFNLAGATIGLRQSFGRGFWFGLAYEATDWRFDPAESDRDALSQEIEAALRFPLGRRAGLRIFGKTAQKDANSPDYDWEGTAYGLALELNPGRRVNLFARVKRRDRDYINAPITDDNFERSDETLDGLINLRVLVGKSWGLGLRAEYRNAESTRPDRNYDAGQIGIGMFFVL
jgi:hypothetical protein